MSSQTPFFTQLRARTHQLGGLFNAHLHLDRAGTLEQTEAIIAARNGGELSTLSLATKHSLIPDIHASSCYDPEPFAKRVNHFLDLLIAAGTTRADSVVDITTDRIGLDAFNQFRSFKQARKDTIDLRIGAYSPLGFKDSEPGRWELLREAATTADFLGSLPERDARINYPDHIGFREHCRRILSLSEELNKPVHIHVDQQNHPTENGTENFLKALHETGIKHAQGSTTKIWLVHVISPSTYDEHRFQRLLANLHDFNVGVICCPSAALSMRQLRTVTTPTGNSIARVLDMLAAGIHVRLGSDNICDITSPAGTADLVDEAFVLCNALRFYNLEILAKLLSGQRLSASEIKTIRTHLDLDKLESLAAIDKLPSHSML